MKRKERERNKQREGKLLCKKGISLRQRERERERNVCVCVCVCERKQKKRQELRYCVNFFFRKLYFYMFVHF